MRFGATLNVPWQAVLQQLVRTLRERRFQAQRTFDLQLARRLLTTGEAEPCPHHGTAPCTCQYLVLQIRSADGTSSAVVIHGHDRTTTISFLRGTGEEARQDMASAMYEALEHLQAASTVRSQTAAREVSLPKERRLTAARAHESRRRRDI
jgi:hypothetical protein